MTLELKYVFKYNSTGKGVLIDINFILQKGKIVCILGNNGSGKSTLLKICAGILNPSYGEVFIDKANISSVPIEERSKKISWLPQNLPRFDNVSTYEFLSLSDYSQTNLTNSIKRSILPCYSKTESLTHPNESDPFGIQRFLYSDLSKLSGGEWKRVQLARIFSLNPSFLLLDEPDSDLDPFYRKNLLLLCKKLARNDNKLILITTHDISFAKQCADIVFALGDGLLLWNSNAQPFWDSKIINKLYGVSAAWL